MRPDQCTELTENAVSQDVLPQSIMRYIIDEELAERQDEPAKLPPLDQLAKQLGVSRGKLREDLIAAQAYGVIEMRPGDGTYVCPFDFYAAVRPLVLYSIACNKGYFDRYYRLRARMEVAFWEEAVRELGRNEMEQLIRIVERAEDRLRGKPIEIPHREHRDFHVLIYSQLNNPFAQGLLKAYWDAYEAVGLHRYFELSSYQRMWSSHRAMVEAISTGDYDAGKTILVQHFTLLEDRLQGGQPQEQALA
jgi:GntR family transcriptional repressor for pyruvate dehydrogenase complex